MNTEEIQKIIEELLRNTGIEFEKVEVSGKAEEPKFLITSKDARLLIGKGGETFSAFVHVVRKIVERQLQGGERIKFSIDINGYQEQKVRETYEKVSLFVDRARALQSDVELPPMQSYERMMVHEALTDISDIKTESVGEGPNRRVVIKYVKSRG